MIIAITNLKGGSGKSTISIHLAVALVQRGKKVCILDTDLEQRSSMKWSGDREEDYPHVSVFGVEVQQLVKETKKLRNDYDVIIIDGAPKIEQHAEIIMIVCDLLLVPLKPSILDYRSTEEFILSYRKVKTLKEMKGLSIEAKVVITDADVRTLAYREIKEVVEQLQEGLFFTIPHYVAYQDAIKEGLGVTEYDKGKANEVFSEFADKITAVVEPV
jgi:chromosome partitioning protein